MLVSRALRCIAWLQGLHLARFWFIVVLPQVRNEGRQRKRHGKPKGGGKSGAQLKSKSWVLKKKAQMRGKGYTAIPVDTKYTARKRKKGF
jgi:hypothetical protein